MSKNDTSNTCQGTCHKEGECTGEVKKVMVYGNQWTREHAFTFFYCQTAIETDEKNGFIVEVLSEM